MRKSARLVSTASADRLAQDRAGRIELTEDELDRVAGGVLLSKKKEVSGSGTSVEEQEEKLVPGGDKKK